MKKLMAVFMMLSVSYAASAQMIFNCNTLIDGNVEGRATDTIISTSKLKLTIDDERITSNDSTMIDSFNGVPHPRLKCLGAKENGDSNCQYNTSTNSSGGAFIKSKSDSLVQASAKIVNIDDCPACTSAVFSQSFDLTTKQLRISYKLIRFGILPELLFDVVRQCE